MAAGRAPLRAVRAGEGAPRRRAKTVVQAASGENPRELLVAMRARAAKAIDDPKTPAQALAALMRRLSEIAKEIEAIDAANEQEGGAGGEPSADEAFTASAI